MGIFPFKHFIDIVAVGGDTSRKPAKILFSCYGYRCHTDNRLFSGRFLFPKCIVTVFILTLLLIVHSDLFGSLITEQHASGCEATAGRFLKLAPTPSSCLFIQAKTVEVLNDAPASWDGLRPVQETNRTGICQPKMRAIGSKSTGYPSGRSQTVCLNYHFCL